MKAVHRFVAAGLAVAGLLLIATPVRAADKAVPYKVCLTQQQAAQVYPGKRLKYREVGKERCWYAGKTLPKHAFITNPRATGVAVIPARQSNTEQQRVQVAPVSSILAAGTSLQDMAADAFLALTGRPESAYSFDAYWAEMTGWAR